MYPGPAARPLHRVASALKARARAGPVASRRGEIPPMTLANKITILRILMIPMFVLVTLDYVKDFQKGEAHDWQYCLAFAIFAIAAVSDALDGYIARRYQQKTELGTLLDPMADKALLLSALILLSRSHGAA